MSTTFLSALVVVLGLTIRDGTSADCGQRARENYQMGRIAGGSSSQVGQWPWQAMVYATRSGGFYYTFCGGTILSEDWIMTAASCFLTTDTIMVYVGKIYSDRATLEAGQQIRPASRSYQHPHFSGTTYGYDVGLLKLSSKIQFTDTVRPVCLPPGTKYNVPSGTRCYISGWGHTSSSSSDLSYTLRHADVKTKSESSCSKSYPYSYPQTLMCAQESGTSICEGDGGGPLVCERGNYTWYQYGIGSMSIDHCGTGPDFFTEVTEVYSWIYDTTGLDFPPPDGALSCLRCGNAMLMMTLASIIAAYLY